jgi:hypothetical protein
VSDSLLHAGHEGSDPDRDASFGAQNDR